MLASLPDYHTFRLMAISKILHGLEGSEVKLKKVSLSELDIHVISTLLQLARPPFDEGWNLGFPFLTLPLRFERVGIVVEF